MPRRSLTLALASCLVLGAFGAASSVVTRDTTEDASDGRSWRITSGDTFALRTDKGALGVKESISVDFSGAFTGFYRDIPLGPAQGSDVTSVSDSELGRYRPGGSAALGSEGEPGTFGTAVLPEGRRIVWHHDTVGSKTFTAAYGIEPVGSRYSDADWLQVSMWGDDWPSFVPAIRGTLALDSPLPPGATIATEPSWIGAKAKLSDCKHIDVTARDIPDHQGLSVTVRLPRGALPGSVITEFGKAPTQGAGTLDGVKRATTDSPPLRFAVWSLALLLLGQMPALGWLLFHRRRLADAPWVGSYDFGYQPPKGQSLPVGYVAAEETRPPSDRAYVATLMDLIARGHYGRENVRDERSGDWRLQIALPESRDPTATVSGGEAAVISFTDLLLVEGPCVVDDLDSRVNPADHRVAFGQMKQALLSDGREVAKEQRSANWWVKSVAGIWIVAVALATIILTSPPSSVHGMLVLGAFVSVIAISVFEMRTWPRGDFVRSPAELASIRGEWQRWRDWILHFDQMNDAPDLGVILWERAFAGALMWGVAAKFVARAKVLVPDLPEDTLALGNSAFFASSLGSSVSSAAAPPPSGDGGGSFGGGGFGGGGGGGGGGGAW